MRIVSFCIQSIDNVRCRNLFHLKNNDLYTNTFNLSI